MRTPGGWSRAIRPHCREPCRAPEEQQPEKPVGLGIAEVAPERHSGRGADDKYAEQHCGGETGEDPEHPPAQVVQGAPAVHPTSGDKETADHEEEVHREAAPGCLMVRAIPDDITASIKKLG